jgi:hypothetical protein
MPLVRSERLLRMDIWRSGLRAWTVLASSVSLGHPRFRVAPYRLGSLTRAFLALRL